MERLGWDGLEKGGLEKNNINNKNLNFINLFKFKQVFMKWVKIQDFENLKGLNQIYKPIKN